MAVAGSLSDIAGVHTGLSPDAVEHLKRLVAAWGVIADLGFADLLLFGRRLNDPDCFVVLAQARATTGQTLYTEDQVGEMVTAEQRPLVAMAFESGEHAEGEVDWHGMKVTVEVAPVRCAGRLIAVLSRESPSNTGRRPSPLERTYLETAQALLRMVASGTFPFPASATEPNMEHSLRVGDGIIRVDLNGAITYASPNALSAFHRLGVVPSKGHTLADLGLDDSVVRKALTMVAPVIEELERAGTVVVLGVIPLIENRLPVGGLVLVRDVTELRVKERLLLSKDATIREIHHRVKNNLQTIASLLRLQGRRLASSEAKSALEESVRRIRSIALVHDTLSRDVGEIVEFRTIVRPLVAMVEEGLAGPDTHLSFVVEGDPGELPADVATPLAVVLTELLQNAVEHGFGDDEEARSRGEVRVTMARSDGCFQLTVQDNGAGLPAGFDPERDSGLGLQIVRTLVHSELSGRIDLRGSPGQGTLVHLEIPLREVVG